jgi:hypothetical protein
MSHALEDLKYIIDLLNSNEEYKNFTYVRLSSETLVGNYKEVDSLSSTRSIHPARTELGRWTRNAIITKLEVKKSLLIAHSRADFEIYIEVSDMNGNPITDYVDWLVRGESHLKLLHTENIYLFIIQIVREKVGSSFELIYDPKDIPKTWQALVTHYNLVMGETFKWQEKELGAFLLKRKQ